MTIRRKLLIGVSILVVLVGGSIAAYGLLNRKPIAGRSVATATFNFDESKAPGWWTAGSLDIGAGMKTDTPQPTVTMIIAQGTKGQEGGDCFVEYFYWANNTKDLTTALNEQVTPNKDLTPQFVNTTSQSINTLAGETPFQLYRYNLTGPMASQMSDGEEFGFLKAGTGYIDIRGYCKTADELSVTLPVFSAVSFTP